MTILLEGLEGLRRSGLNWAIEVVGATGTFGAGFTEAFFGVFADAFGGIGRVELGEVYKYCHA